MAGFWTLHHHSAGHALLSGYPKYEKTSSASAAYMIVAAGATLHRLMGPRRLLRQTPSVPRLSCVRISTGVRRRERGAASRPWLMRRMTVPGRMAATGRAQRCSCGGGGRPTDVLAARPASRTGTHVWDGLCVRHPETQRSECPTGSRYPAGRGAGTTLYFYPWTQKLSHKDNAPLLGKSGWVT